jgi:hypothetical protein
MSPTVKGLIFAGLAATVQLVMGLFLIRTLARLPWDAAVLLSTGGVIIFGLYGFFAGRKEIYALEPRAVWAFVLDISWSAINTVTGLVWMIWCAAKGTFRQPTPETQKRGIIVFLGAALPGADATTLGTVVGGRWLLHEAVHVQQARIFGPFYWPIYLGSYAANLLVQILTLQLKNPHWQAYGRVVMEDWAYRSAPQDDAVSVDRAASLRWFGLAFLHGLALAVTLASIIGLLPLPWWPGPAVIFAYSLARGVLPESKPAQQRR